jgi:hypothetical protein
MRVQRKHQPQRMGGGGDTESGEGAKVFDCVGTRRVLFCVLLCDYHCTWVF